MNHPQDRMRVLVIDDEADMCWALQRILEAEGYEPIVAKNAEEAVLALEEGELRLAFVDAKLPDMEGLDLAARMRTICPALPCVLVSGYFYDDDDLVKDGLARGVICGFIGKPFLLEQIRDAIRLAEEVRQHGEPLPHAERLP